MLTFIQELKLIFTLIFNSQHIKIYTLQPLIKPDRIINIVLPKILGKPLIFFNFLFYIFIKCPKFKKYFYIYKEIFLKF